MSEKKPPLKMTIFKDFFFIPPNPKSEKDSRKLTNKRILALLFCLCSHCSLDQAGQTIPDEIMLSPLLLPCKTLILSSQFDQFSTTLWQFQ